MKKSLLAVLLAVAMVVPAFAAKGDISVDAKVGLGVSNSFKLMGIDGESDAWEGFKAKTPFSVGADFFYGISDIISVGLGANYIFDAETKMNVGHGMEEKFKSGTTNIYVAVKPEFKIESDIFSNIYLIGQIGLAMNRASIDVPEYFSETIDIDNGLYLGAGFGTTIKDCVIVELLFSSSNGSAAMDGDFGDVQYTATTFSVGYKFNI